MKKCVFCELSDEVVDFDEEKFKKCSNMLAFRKGKAFQYGTIELSKDSLCKYGYHKKCLKKVLIVKERYKQGFDDFESARNVSINNIKL